MNFQQGHNLTKSVSNWLPITERTARTKSVSNQKVIKEKSLSMLLFQQFFFPLTTTTKIQL